ncbi:MAG: glycosyltransferase family 39 protein, partial [Pseudomonadota bacterium]
MIASGWLGLSLFGYSPMAAAFVPIVLYWCLLAAVYFLTRRLSDPDTALLALLLVAVVPDLTFYSTTLFPVVYETLFCVVVVLCFVRFGFSDEVPSASVLIALGLLVGLAFTSRQFAGALVVYLGVLYLMGFGISRWRYWWMALGTVLIIAADVAFHWVMTGNPLNRVEGDLAHTTIHSEHLSTGTSDGFPLFNIQIMQDWLPYSEFP